MKTLIIERKLSKIRNWQNEKTIKYFLLKNDCNEYEIMISQQQTNNKNTELEINKSFDDKQTALNLIKSLYENPISPEQSSEVVEDLLKNKENKI